jgi:quercetin dioxygenase-like cupin family protein
MLNRRGFIGCAICAAVGLVAEGVSAQSNTPTPGVKRTILQQTDGPAEGYVTILARGEIGDGGVVPWHTHPGIESGYLISGTGTMFIKGQPDRKMQAGDSFHIPPETPHSVQCDTAMQIASTYVVEKGKPLATVVKM